MQSLTKVNTPRAKEPQSLYLWRTCDVQSFSSLHVCNLSHHTVGWPPYGEPNNTMYRNLLNTKVMSVPGKARQAPPSLRRGLVCLPAVSRSSPVSLQETIPILIELKHFGPLGVYVPTNLNPRV